MAAASSQVLQLINSKLKLSFKYSLTFKSQYGLQSLGSRTAKKRGQDNSSIKTNLGQAIENDEKSAKFLISAFKALKDDLRARRKDIKDQDQPRPKNALTIREATAIQGIDPGLVTMTSGVYTTPSTLIDSIKRYQGVKQSAEDDKINTSKLTPQFIDKACLEQSNIHSCQMEKLGINPQCPRRLNSNTTTTNRDQNNAMTFALDGSSSLLSEDGLLLLPFRKQISANKNLCMILTYLHWFDSSTLKLRQFGDDSNPLK
ncbi:hypothetical protein [Parasitella parasitica]|uniref:Uncharacterized protein n=1 Tax=Parasitella parasitica TaxID=35722 RepID=A0A0B7N2H3_9FUNG|nr:hypothetical protein [Parasitella parasitica]